jgi:hypothetical protein
MKRLLGSTLTLARKGGGLLLLLTALCNLAGAHVNPPAAAPEIDPGSIVGALGLASTGLLMLTDRARRK